MSGVSQYFVRFPISRSIDGSIVTIDPQNHTAIHYQACFTVISSKFDPPVDNQDRHDTRISNFHSDDPLCEMHHHSQAYLRNIM